MTTVTRPGKVYADLIRKVDQVRTYTNKLTVSTTQVGTTKARITFPEQGTQFTIYHNTAAVLWLGNEADVAVGGATSMPVPAGMEVKVEITEGSEPDIWGVVASGTIDTYAYGVIKE